MAARAAGPAGPARVLDPEASLRAYEGRMNRAIDFISAHLGEDLRLELIAREACFSPFHFHRIFRGMVGETPADFVRRLRLERAASRLLAERPPSVTEVALDYGFSSPAAFARAFKERFGASATSFRAARLRKRGKAARKAGDAAGGAAAYLPPRERNRRRSEMGYKFMGGEVKEFPARRVAYVRRTGPYGPGIGACYERLMRWAGPRGLAGPGAEAFSIYHDDPEVTAPAKCRSDACLVVDDGVSGEGEVGVQTVPGGAYALCRYEITGMDFGGAWNHAMGEWLPRSGYECREAPCLEICHGLDDPRKKKAIDVTIAVPVKPLRA